MAEVSPSLTPGVGWHLSPQGQWVVKEIPQDVLSGAEFSGYLTIDGYRASVFETPSGEQWAQKSVNTPATASSTVFGSRSPRRNPMGPKQTAEHLRMIASKLDKSSNPNKDLVIRDLKHVLANMGLPPAPGAGGDAQQAQQQQEALPQSGTGKQMLKKMLDDAQKALDAGDEAGFKGALEKALKHG